MKQFDHDCTKNCTGDKLASCGGPNVVSSYITDDSGKLKKRILYF